MLSVSQAFKILLIVWSSTLLLSCSMTRGLEPGQLIHGSTKIEFVNPRRVYKEGKLASDLYQYTRPKPASGLQRWQVAIYQSVKRKGKTTGFRAWLQRKLGRPPVLFEPARSQRSSLVMEKYLSDHGYFNARVEMDTSVRRKKVTVTYRVTSRGRYRVGEVFSAGDMSSLALLLNGFQHQTLLRTKQSYNQELIAKERDRLADIANDHGYFDVTRDDFYFFVDTTRGNYQADLYLRIRQPLDSNGFRVHYLDQTWIYPDHSLDPDLQESKADTLLKGANHMVQTRPVVRQSVLNRIIWQNDPPVFSKKEQRNTINRLLDLGIFKFADIRFEKKGDQDSCHLDRFILLTPGLMRDVEFGLQANSRSGNFLGTEASFSYAHKNLFKGAELLDIDVTTGLETNIGANATNLINTVNLSVQTHLGLPGIYAPFYRRKEITGESLPRTSFGIGDDFQKRTGFYTVNSFNLNAGYTWQKVGRQQEFSPLFINLVHVLQTSDKLDQLLLDNRRLRSSFENVLIAGMNYHLTLSNQAGNRARRAYFFWRGSIETAGTMLQTLTSLFTSKEPRQILGIPYSQYIKIDQEYRRSWPIRRGLVAGRVLLGTGYAYGNAEALPYIKQYFTGGASSIRAFRIRTLGPGSYESKIEDNGSNFVDQTGDMKLEMNLEYRFPMISYLKGAVFADAGNIWLIHGDADESTLVKEGLFKIDQFYREIAIGTGFGWRLDFNVAVIRLDLAFPVRKPSVSKGNRWLFREIDFGNRSWRRENLVWNIAVGYPF